MTEGKLPKELPPVVKKFLSADDQRRPDLDLLKEKYPVSDAHNWDTSELAEKKLIKQIASLYNREVPGTKEKLPKELPPVVKKFLSADDQRRPDLDLLKEKYPVSDAVLALNTHIAGKGKMVASPLTHKGNKYHAVRTWSNYSKRHFDSKLEAGRADDLYLMEKAGKIRNLQYQIKFTLCENPKITYTCDFTYQEFDPLTLSGGMWKDVYEDSKGVLTRDTRTKLAWLKEKFGISVNLVK